MRKRIDLNVSLTPSQCGCGHGAKEKSDAHPAAAEDDCCGDGVGVDGAAHRHEEGCCRGAHARPAATRDRDAIPDKDGIPDKTEGAGR